MRGAEERLEDWLRPCDYLASSLNDYSNTLMIQLEEFDKTNDTEGALLIRSSCIACLAHLAALYHFIGEMQPDDGARANGLCDAALDNLGELTQGTKLEEVTYLDLLLKVPLFPPPLAIKSADASVSKYSWTKATRVYDSRIRCLPLGEDARLRYWKDIVAEACMAFERRLPKCEPPILTAMALLEDGRSEGSEYPNFMLPSTRDRYGI